LWISYRVDNNGIKVGYKVNISGYIYKIFLTSATSRQAPALCQLGGVLYLAWQNLEGVIMIARVDGQGNLSHEIEIARGSDPVLAATSDRIYIAWLDPTKTKDGMSEIMYSTSTDGSTFSGPYATNAFALIRPSLCAPSAPDAAGTGTSSQEFVLLYWDTRYTPLLQLLDQDVVYVALLPPNPATSNFGLINPTAVEPELWSKPPIGLGSVSNYQAQDGLFVTDQLEDIWGCFSTNQMIFSKNGWYETLLEQPPQPTTLRSAAACAAVTLGDNDNLWNINITYRGPDEDEVLRESDLSVRQGIIGVHETIANKI